MFHASNWDWEKIRTLSEISPSSLIPHEVWPLLQELSGLSKERPAHGPWGQALLPVPHLIPPQQAAASNQEPKAQTKNHSKQSHIFFSPLELPTHLFKLENEMGLLKALCFLISQVYKSYI